MPWYHIQDKKLKLTVRAKPNARNTSIREVTDTEVVVNVSAPPADNKANKELVEFISKMLKVPKSLIKIVAGTTCAIKTVVIGTWEGSAGDLEAAVGEMLE
ncbi:YggU-like protein NOTE(s): PFAM [Encephalitozoon cuniculi]|nr:YggU-like protein NOTE(s): PFAM [Encephalitozoon cuniculi]